MDNAFFDVQRRKEKKERHKLRKEQQHAQSSGNLMTVDGLVSKVMQ